MHGYMMGRKAKYARGKMMWMVGKEKSIQGSSGSSAYFWHRILVRLQTPR
jgi:hypothetical protein